MKLIILILTLSFLTIVFISTYDNGSSGSISSSCLSAHKNLENAKRQWEKAVADHWDNNAPLTDSQYNQRMSAVTNLNQNCDRWERKKLGYIE